MGRQANQRSNMDIDTSNEFIVGAIGDDLTVMLAPRLQHISKDQALRLAAWLVAMADDDNKFPEILKAIQNT